MKISLLLLLFCGMAVQVSLAQLPHDAIYMSKRSTCVALMATHTTWSSYWENTLKRTNANIGTQTTQSFMPMVAIGLGHKLNLLAALPYVRTFTSAGNLMPQQGFQDAAVWLKYRVFQHKGISGHLVGGASMPVRAYVADFLPLSIGMGAKAAVARGIFSYKHNSGIYTTAHASYTYRSNIQVDRNGYYANGRLYDSHEMSVPNAIDAGLRVGFDLPKMHWQTEVFAERFACVSGDNIRRNDMPLPTNNTQLNNVGVYTKYQPKHLGVSARVSQVISGRNVGQGTQLMLGLLWQLNY